MDESYEGKVKNTMHNFDVNDCGNDCIWLLHVAFADPQKAYDRINWIVIWSVLKMLLVVVTILVQG